jgi:hypothetical protein
MRESKDWLYFAKRESIERFLAQAAVTPQARSRHLQMAYRYASLQDFIEHDGQIIADRNPVAN